LVRFSFLYLAEFNYLSFTNKQLHWFQFSCNMFKNGFIGSVLLVLFTHALSAKNEFISPCHDNIKFLTFSLPPSPELLNAYMLKSYNNLNNYLISKNFKIVSNKLIYDEMSGSGKQKTTIYKIKSQTVKVISHVGEGRFSGKVTQIDVSTDESNFFNREMTKDEVAYYMETMHTDILKAANFKLDKEKTKNSENGGFYMYKGDQNSGDYIECHFYTDGNFTFYISFYIPEGD